MADFVDMLSPEGEVFEVPSDRVGAALDEGFRLSDGGPPLAAVVDMVSPEGETFEVPSDRVAAVSAEGFRLARDVAVERAHEGVGETVATFAEGVGRGVSLGFDAPVVGLEGVGTWLGNKLFEATRPDDEGRAPVSLDASIDEQKRMLSERREAHPYAAGTGELVGVVAPMIATGGASGLARGAITPAASLARGATGFAQGLIQGTGAIAKVGRLVTAGVVEGAAYGASREVNESYLRGDYEGVAEKALAGAGQGALWGGAVSGALGGASELAQKAMRLARKYIPSAADFASGRAFKAAVGGTRQKAFDQAVRAGGWQAVGKTALDEGIVTAGSSLDDIAAKASVLRAEVGRSVRDLVGQIDEAGKLPDTGKIAQRIWDEVVAPLKESKITAGMADRLEGTLAGVFDELTDPAKRHTFQSLWEQRKVLDTLLQYERKSVSPIMAEMQTARRVYESAFADLAEEAQVGGAAWKAAYREAKRRYSHIAVIDDVAQDGIIQRAKNNMISLNDTISGAATGAVGMLSGGPIGAVSAVAGALGHKILRERGDAFLAGTLYRLGSHATSAQEAVRAASRLPLLTRQAAQSAVQKGVTVEWGNNHNRALQEAIDLGDRDSEVSQDARGYLHLVEQDDPQLAAAVGAQIDRRAEYLRAKAGPAVDLGVESLDDLARLSLARHLEAARSPQAALARASTGDATAEDLEALKALTPRLFAEFRRKALAQLATHTGEIDPETAAQLSRVLGVPVRRSQGPAYAGAMQRLAAQTARAKAPSTAQSKAPAGMATRSQEVSGL